MTKVNANKVNYPLIKLGVDEYDNTVYLEPPSWDCDWYWGFGYLETKDSHYHLSSLFEKTDLKKGIDIHFKKFLITDNTDKWKFAEIVRTIYHLREIAELYYIGGSNYKSINEQVEIVQNKEEWYRINYEVIPKLFKLMYDLLDKHNKK